MFAKSTPKSTKTKTRVKKTRQVVKKVKKYRVRTVKTNPIKKSPPTIRASLPTSIDETDSVTNETLNTIYQMLGINNATRKMCSKLNTMPYPDRNKIKFGKNSNIPEAGTLEQLILNITNEKSEKEAQDDFIITLTSFTDIKTVLAAVFTRLLPDTSNPKCNIKNLKVQQAKVVNLFRSAWYRYVTFQLKPTNITNSLQYFSDNAAISPTLKSVITELTKQVRKNSDPKVTIRDYPLLLPDGDEYSWKLTNIPELELARQITYFHNRLFMKITPLDLLNAAWGRKSGYKAKPIEEMTNQFNAFSAFVSKSIIQGSRDPHKRGRIIKRWIDVAWLMLHPELDPADHQKLVNYHGVFAIMFGLTHRSVLRLTKTQKYAKRTNRERASHYQYMLELTSIKQNFAVYRKEIETATNIIPFMGVFQKDLVYITEFYPNEVKGLINFQKCHEVSNLVKFVNSFQIQSRIKPHTRIQVLIHQIPTGFDTVQLMNMSRAAEPDK